MRIAFLTQVLPYPLDAGPKVRSYYTLRTLAERHDVSLISFTRSTDTPEAIDHLRDFCESVVTIPMTRTWDLFHFISSLITSTPFLIRRDWRTEMSQAIRTVMCDVNRPIDAVHADQLWMAPYALRAASEVPSERRPVLVLDQHNAVFQVPRRLAQAESNVLRRAAFHIEASKMRSYEPRICQAFDQVIWVTDEDLFAVNHVANTVRSMTQTSHAHVIPICVSPDENLIIPRCTNSRRVTFLGGLHWPPNAEGIHWFADHVWPLVLERCADAVLTIIGREPAGGLDRLVGRPSVQITGYVDDPAPYLRETGAFIVPLHSGGGMRVKILDAWCWGLPIVTTTIGAEGIAMRDQENGLVADTASDFADAVIRLLRDPTLDQRIVRGGRAAVESQYNWRTTYRAWHDIYDPLSAQAVPMSRQAP
ncbi:MAG: glycosyltransferase family 4 protein [Chloroflexota bacterium]